jgi:alpha-tubulin suppressor-like RCC1 family protein
MDAIMAATHSQGSYILRSNGTLLYFGKHDQPDAGQHLLITKPQSMPYLSDIVHIGCGEVNAYALDGNGVLWQWPTTQALSAIPQRVEGLPGLISMSTGHGERVTAIDRENRAWAWRPWQYWESPEPTQLMPKYVYEDSGELIVSTAASFYGHTVLRSDGLIVSWGRNKGGALGSGLVDASPVPVQIPGLQKIDYLSEGSLYSKRYARDSSGQWWTWDESGARREAFEGLSKLEEIRCSGFGTFESNKQTFTVAKTMNGSLLTWGWNLQQPSW